MSSEVSNCSLTFCTTTLLKNAEFRSITSFWTSPKFIKNDLHSLMGLFYLLLLNLGLEKLEQYVCINECILTLCSFFDDHLKRFSNVFIFTQDNSHIMLHPVLRTPNERTRAVGDVVKCLGEELIPGIRKEVLLQITKMIYWFSSFLQWVDLCYQMLWFA